jgi:phosphopantothenoylcysteine decarboxylase/phosphopantothenate--cysteine ligase
MAEPEVIVGEAIGRLSGATLRGRHVLVTAGPTAEDIDPVRYIGNRSSGKMGFAIAERAAQRGAQVTLIAGPVSLPTPAGVRRIDVKSAQQMHDAVLPLATQHDVFVATAAVADWRPAGCSEHKIKKDGSGAAPSIPMRENPDILASVARIDGAPYCVGFAAESHELARHAAEKRVRKGIPLIVGNIGPDTFGREDNALLLVDAKGTRELPRAGKLALARALVADIATRLKAE